MKLFFFIAGLVGATTLIGFTFLGQRVVALEGLLILVVSIAVLWIVEKLDELLEAVRQTNSKQGPTLRKK